MNYEDLVTFLEKQTQSHDIPYLKNVLDLLNLKINPEKVIIVAGTNGKGSTCATLQSLFSEARKTVGFFSSPHLEKINERIKFNGENISDKDFVEIFYEVKNKIQNIELSYFEWLTFMAAYYFFEKNNADYAIFEVGLGGTYDSTNIIPHNNCVITRLDFDHKDRLGNTIEEIAKNKFGIISQNNFVFHTEFVPKVEKISKQYITKYNAKFIKACNFALDVEVKNKNPSFYVVTPFGKFLMNLSGKRAAENTALALTAFDFIIGDTNKYAPTVLKKVNWPGRMTELSYDGRKIFLSGDHNPNGIESLLELLQYYDFEKVHFVLGICKDKEHKKMLDMLHNFPNSEIYLTETPEKTLHINQYDQDCLNYATIATPHPIEALDYAIKNASKNDMVIVTGSLYLVGKILVTIKSKKA